MNENSCVLALITAQSNCARIIKTAKEYADRFGCALDVLTVQPLKADAKQRSKDMLCLTALAKEQKVNIRIAYSNKPVHAIAAEVKQSAPVHVFIGQSGEKATVNEHLFAPFGLPVSVVGTNGVIYTLPALALAQDRA